MEEAFGTLVWIVVGVAAVVAVFTLVGTGRSYDEIGAGGIVGDDGFDGDDDGFDGDDALAPADREREEEIRQLLQARNARRARRGEAPLDVEQQLAALARPPAVVDEALREEVRQHVLARNARRARAGAQPLDVEREIERRIRELN